MAPTFRHSKGVELLFNNVAMGQVLTGVTVESSVDALDTTTIDKADRTKIPGLRDGTLSVEGLIDGTRLSTASTGTTGAFDERWGTALGSTARPVVTYLPEGSTAIGRRARIMRIVDTKYAAMSPAADVVKFAADASISGPQEYGVVLHPLKARTSTSSTFAAVDSGIAAGTTGGGIATFHMTAASTVSTLQVRVQHSSAAVSWADLITFSSSTGTTSAGAYQASTVSGVVKRHVRAIIPVFTGGAGKTATFAVAFARSNKPIR